MTCLSSKADVFRFKWMENRGGGDQLQFHDLYEFLHFTIPDRRGLRIFLTGRSFGILAWDALQLCEVISEAEVSPATAKTNATSKNTRSSATDSSQLHDSVRAPQNVRSFSPLSLSQDLGVERCESRR